MGLVIVLLVLVVGGGWFAWRRRRYRQTHVLPVSSQSRPRENAVHTAFVHGNTCMREGKFDEARAAFHQACEIEPKHPHIAGRLAEGKRQEQAASATVPAHVPC